jgi:hypothetical protein
MDEKINTIVKKLYTNGSSHRAQKSSNPNTLVNHIIKSNKDIVTLGLYRNLPKNVRDIIHDKKRSDERESAEFIKSIAEILLTTDHPGIYCRISDRGRYLLKCIMTDKYDKLSKGEKSIFNIRNIFSVQERQICTD